MRQFTKPLQATIVLFVCIGTCNGQITDPPSSPTLWSFLGVPQGLQKVKGAVMNRRGKHPKLEPKPAIKAIADQANLESPVDAIRKAAEIKVAEDLKPQKIKAIRYLTKIGCGCYDKDGSITDALIAASDDCTPDVRLTVMEEVYRAIRGKCCSKCGATCCCNEKMAKRLAEVAYHKDDTGCYLEPNADIRAAAARALAACCPDSSPVIEVYDEEPLPQTEPEYEGESEDSSYDGESGEASEESGESTEADNETAAWDGVLIHVDAQQGIAHVHLDNPNQTLAVGTALQAYGTVDGEIVPVGVVTVYETFQGSANVRISDEPSRQALVKGVAVVASPMQQPAPIAQKQPTFKAVSSQPIAVPSQSSRRVHRAQTSMVRRLNGMLYAVPR